MEGVVSLPRRAEVAAAATRGRAVHAHVHVYMHMQEGRAVESPHISAYYTLCAPAYSSQAPRLA